jgi:hypothetical protein
MSRRLSDFFADEETAASAVYIILHMAIANMKRFLLGVLAVFLILWWKAEHVSEQRQEACDSRPHN